MSFKNRIKNTIFFFLNIFFCFSRREKASVLMYHSVGENNIMFNVTPEDFERQMSYLKRKKYNVIKLSELASVMRNRAKFEKKTIVITLDDGFKNNYANAFHVLKKYNFPATIFLATAYIGKKMGNSFGVPLDIMSWEEAREMEESGLIDFAFHSHTHPQNMSELSFDDFRQEIEISKKLMFANLKKPLMFFAYPRGKFNQEQKEFLQQNGFDAGLEADDGLVKAGDDPFSIKRNFIYSKGGFSQFKGKLCSTVEVFNKIRDFFKAW